MPPFGPPFAEDAVPVTTVTTWAGVAALTLPALFAVGAWLGKWLQGRRQRAEAMRDGLVVYLQGEVAAKDRVIVAREDECRLTRQQAAEQTQAVIRLHQIYGGCRRNCERMHGDFRVAQERLLRANAELRRLGRPTEDIPEVPESAWQPDAEEAEFLTRSVVQGQKVIEAVSGAVPQVPPPPGADRRE